MGTVWFCLVAIMLAGYVVLDGFDIGVGILHLWLGRTDAERRILMRSIGPVWDGNEVWLIAAGGTLYFAFPLLYASSFSGFYLPLMMVLWLLILRGISLEFRSHISQPIWSTLWDTTFSLASLLLAVFYGAALGNVVRGVPLDANGRFFEPLWTNFMPSGETGILDWYTVLVGVVALAVLTLHGATWLGLKTEGELYSRAVRSASAIWWLVAFLTVVLTRVRVFERVHCGDADERGFQRLSKRATGQHESCLRTYRGERKSERIWLEDRADLVADRNSARERIHCIRLPQFCWESQQHGFRRTRKLLRADRVCVRTMKSVPQRLKPFQF
jgi:cytochrome d oxidase subunit CydB